MKEIICQLQKSKAVMMGCWILNESLSIILVLSWLGVNLYLFIDTFYWYEEEESFLYTRVILGSTLAWARASAVCLNFNCMLILLPVSRNLISFMRGTSTCFRGPWKRQLDKNLKFHKLVAYGIVINATIHVVAHLFNLEHYHWSQSPEAEGLVAALSKLGDTPNETYLNPIRTFHTNTITELLTTIAGITGLLISLALILIMTSSTEFIRQVSYELFWYTHHVFIVFFIGLAIHGAGRIVRGQTPESLLRHNITFCRDHLEEWQARCPVPQFSGKEPSAWKWVLGPVVLYACERIIRFWRFQQEVIITKVVSHPSGVLELCMKKSGFKMAPGQYVLIQCPSISTLEWHPFTLTSAPQDDYFSVHIRAAGDWTQALRQAFGAEGQPLKEPWNLPRLAVDGPFGAALTDVFHYPVSMCIAAGIGVTPFAALLKSIWYQCCEAQTQCKLNKVYFYWICRDPGAFEWFADLLLSLETKMSEQGKAHFLSYHIFLTGWDENQAFHIALHWDENADVITGLRQKTFYGRPNWNHEFQQVAFSHPRFWSLETGPEKSPCGRCWAQFRNSFEDTDEPPCCSVKFVTSEHSPACLHQSLDVVSAWVIGSRPQKEGPKLDSENKSKLSGVWRQNHQQKMNINTQHHRQRSLNRSETHRAFSGALLVYMEMTHMSEAACYQQNVSSV